MMEAGAYGFAISKLVFENRSGQWELVSREFVDVTDSSPVDAAMQAAVDQVLLQAAPDASRILGQVREPMSREALAGWLSKAFLGVTRADLSISNLGAVKDPVGVGSLTLELLLSYILPYNDPLVGVDMSRMELEQALCKSSKRPRDSFEDNGSELFLSGARLVIEENGACRLEGLKKSQIKVAMPAFVAKRSARWIGLDLSRRSFAFGVDQNHAVLTALRVRPELP
jgi:2',3'-cyclic-nucleotide 2'-phosphodiesterase (5'-nucleotidase family)